MRLCFGTFTSVLNHCRQNIYQAALIAQIVNIVDSGSRYLGKKMAGDGPAINKLLSCKIDFAFSKEIANIPLETVISKFETNISPFIDEDKKAKVIIALLNIIKNDDSIDIDKRENFIKYLGCEKQQLLQQSEFVFSDFVGKILLYTTLGNVKNRVGQECVKEITDNYIDNLAKPYANELQWDVSSQTLTLLHAKMFQLLQKAITLYHIDDFIEKTDPTNMMNIRELERCNGFIVYTRDNIWIPFGQKSISWTLQKIQQFAQTLDDYTTFLGTNVRPMTENHPDTFVPLHRDEHPKWELWFSKETINYRQQLIDLYQEIYMHMLYSPSN